MEQIVNFLDRGGAPLWLIALLFLLLWFAVIKQSFFYLVDYAVFRSDLINKSSKKFSKAMLINYAKKQFFKSTNIIKLIIRTAPLLGLLGTVMGMIEVFETLSFYGTGDPKLMSDGIAKATLPTMAGMVVAIVGLFFASLFATIGNKRLAKLKEELV